MSQEQQEIEQLMKKCQRGVGNYPNALDDANNLLSECYGLLGKCNLRIAFKNSELSYLYGQDRVPSTYKQRIKTALDI
jgi:hypothetical protein